MEILIDRKWKKPAYTIGVLSIDGRVACNTLEDTDRGLRQDMSETDIRKKKVWGKTAIPTGRYVVGFTYSPKFSQYSYAKGGGKIPVIYGVKGFDAIRIHSGNKASDSEGCVLLGRNTAVGQVLQSVKTCEQVFDVMFKAYLKGETIYLTIQ